jgi:uncharacterized protein YtpQ (UPF0354 family)
MSFNLMKIQIIIIDQKTTSTDQLVVDRVRKMNMLSSTKMNIHNWYNVWGKVILFIRNRDGYTLFSRRLW